MMERFSRMQKFGSTGGRLWVCVCVALLVIVAGTLANGGSAAASASWPSGWNGVSGASPVLSTYESSTVALGRDGGISVGLPNGNDLWLFGDTPIYQNTGAWNLKKFIAGPTAAEETSTAVGQIPSALDEVPSAGKPLSLSPQNAPSSFLGAATTYLANGESCTNASAYSARWISGAAVITGTNDVLISYLDVCDTAPTWVVEGWGFLKYNFTNNQIDAGPDDVFPPSTNGTAIPVQDQFGSPVISGGERPSPSSLLNARILPTGYARREVFGETPCRWVRFPTPPTTRPLPFSVPRAGRGHRPTSVLAAIRTRHFE
jgi:hypothetical protein